MGGLAEAAEDSDPDGGPDDKAAVSSLHGERVSGFFSSL